MFDGSKDICPKKEGLEVIVTTVTDTGLNLHLTGCFLDLTGCFLSSSELSGRHR